MKLYKRIRNLVIEAGWYSGEYWAAFQFEVFKYMPDIGYFVVLYIQIGKAAVSIALDLNREVRR